MGRLPVQDRAAHADVLPVRRRAGTAPPSGIFGVWEAELNLAAHRRLAARALWVRGTLAQILIAGILIGARIATGDTRFSHALTAVLVATMWFQIWSQRRMQRRADDFSALTRALVSRDLAMPSTGRRRRW